MSATTTTTTASSSDTPTPHVPGEPGVWVFVLGDVGVFTALFATYLVYRAEAPGSFAAAQRLLSPTVGAADTLLLLTSSLLVAWGLLARRRGRPGRATALVLGAIACGVAFSALKVVEYHAHVAGGDVPAGNDFWMFYSVTTGLHWFHLLVGMLVLVLVARLVRRPGPLSAGQWTVVEGGACFWHMVDLLWIVIFPLLYLLR